MIEEVNETIESANVEIDSGFKESIEKLHGRIKNLEKSNKQKNQQGKSKLKIDEGKKDK